MKSLVFDIETDGLLDEVSKLHCMSYCWGPTEEILTVTDPDEVISILDSADFLIGHNIACYDLLVLKKLFGYEFKGIIIDTLYLSWYLDPKRGRDGLEDYGNEFGVPKIEVSSDEWSKGDLTLMAKRCERDVHINCLLWKKQKCLLEKLYE